MWVLNSRVSRVQTLFSAAGIVVEAYKAYQACQIAKELKGIADKITISNNIQVQGSGGPDGFAAHAWDFVNLKIDQYTSDDGNHRFFVYHPDTQWHGAFRRLLQEKGPLDETFCGISNDLFALCRWMLCMRVELHEQDRSKQDEVHFHVLIPAYQSLVIPRAFVLLEALFPLTFEDEIANGEALVWLNLPFEGTDTLKNVGNLHGLNNATWKRELTVASTSFGTWAILGSGAMGLTAAVAVACPPLTLPVFLISSTSGMAASGKAGFEVERLWDEPPPALLG
jgi:hypothetical protein